MLSQHEQHSLPALDHSAYLGPARVRDIAGRRVQLEFPDALPWADLALGFPYQAAVGDTVLAIGQRGNWYVIGVLHGTGKVSFLVPGDFEVLAPKGRIKLVAGKGFEVKSPAAKISAGKLELVAHKVFERFTDATRWIKDRWQVRAGRVRAEIEGDYHLKAKTISARADEDVKIDGEKIHLG
ncbi:MAG TPA: DUF3540 domain-containing protein [Alphaproteobacteria bacterium]|nr:DUF3540 domain-containing protein [Alphaproteobacteria bacterium]